MPLAGELDAVGEREVERAAATDDRDAGGERNGRVPTVGVEEQTQRTRGVHGQLLIDADRQRPD